MTALKYLAVIVITIVATVTCMLVIHHVGDKDDGRLVVNTRESGSIYVVVLERKHPRAKFEGNAFEFQKYLHSLEPRIAAPQLTDLPIGTIKGVRGVNKDKPVNLANLEKHKPRHPKGKVDVKGKTLREIVAIFAKGIDCRWSAIVDPDGQIGLSFVPLKDDRESGDPKPATEGE